MMNILVVGNGFDIAHGLPTQYKDYLGFLEYCKSVVKFNKTNVNINKDVEEYIINNKIDLKNENQFKILHKIIERNFWFYYFTKRKFDGENWIDFEKEISYLIRYLDQKLPQEEMEIMEEFMGKFLTEENRQDLQSYYYPIFIMKNNVTATILIEDLNDFIKGFEIYLRDFIMKLDFDKKTFNFASNFDRVISFNYTNTFEEIYSERYLNSKTNLSQSKYDYVHGKINMEYTEKCNLVLGIDEYLDVDERSSNTNFIKFKKYFQRIYNETSCKYLNIIENIYEKFEILKEKEAIKPQFHYNGGDIRHTIELIATKSKIEGKKRTSEFESIRMYIIGHSLDVTDKDILEKLIMAPGAKTTIYYHDDNAYANLIANLVKTIGFENVNRKVSGPNKSIFFIDQKEILNKKEEKVLQKQ